MDSRGTDHGRFMGQLQEWQLPGGQRNLGLCAGSLEITL